MANNRINFATAQLAIKDTRADATANILGFLADGTLASGVGTSDGQIAFNESLSGIWGAGAGQFRVQIPDGSNHTIEYIRYTSFLDASTVGGITRATGGSTQITTIPSGTLAQLVGWEPILGGQSASFGVSFNLEDKFHIGQLGAYENVEGIPDVEVTLEKCLDGTKPLWLLCTDPGFVTLKGRTSNYECDVACNVYPDTQDSATGTADSVVVASGMVISSYSLSFTADGNFTESVTLEGNDRTWGGEEGTPSGYFPTESAFNAAVIGSGVQRSENFDRAGSTLPTSIPANDRSKIQSVEVSADITRNDIFSLGSKTPFFKSVEFPITVTTTFTTVTSEGDLVNAKGDGSANLTNESIILKTDAGLTVNLGTQNKLSQVTFDGFDAGGGDAKVSYEYTNSNILTITHDGFADPFDTNQDNNE